MYDLETRKRTLALVGQGRSLNSISKQTGISRATIRAWQARIEPLRQPGECPRCGDQPTAPQPPRAYAYLLGLYLGDGCVSPHPRDGHYLRIACADAWPGLIDACADAMHAVHPTGSVHRLQREGCVSVVSYSRHWPCLFPQHAPGKKHERHLQLTPWQREIVNAHPWDLVRGLVHSDGSRITNWTERTTAGVHKRYEYPRYFFTNKSADIRRLYTDTLDRLGVEWRQANAYNISVARRPSVALMDRHIGPKY
ncbi:transcriptional regulator [Streptantibioticus ferralitis]|uniref:Transcriptional regulator n=1 Tax=Streptantibioticus ferralitis TaxID=236510 RepID=A0ABT5YZK2_9ACTN|nr:transcriptional regulator [Streptantibioticus ferralitis]MDF2257005.1 transcriptional regulator [Streptantibioticus ferralitis]